MAHPWSSLLLGSAFAEAAGYWLAGSGHEVSGCRTLGAPGAGPGGQSQGPGYPGAGALSAVGPGADAGRLVGRASSWDLAVGPRGPRDGVGFLVGETTS